MDGAQQNPLLLAGLCSFLSICWRRNRDGVLRDNVLSERDSPHKQDTTGASNLNSSEDVCVLPKCWELHTSVSSRGSGLGCTGEEKETQQPAFHKSSWLGEVLWAGW